MPHLRLGLCLLAPMLMLLAACGTATPAVSQPIAPSPTRPASPTASPAVAPTPLPARQPTPTSPPDTFFTHPGRDPVVSSGKGTAWDGRYTDPGAVLFHDGTFHMLRNGFRAWPASVQIGYVTSPDGYTWTQQGTDPVLKTDQVSYAGTAALASSVLVLEDGTWVLYFYTWNTEGSGTTGVIGRATAPDPAGPWQPDPEPVLQPGEQTEWDSRQLIAPDVIRTGQGYRMYYSAHNGNTQMIGLATSADGVTWTKHNDPTTPDAPFADSDPVLTLGDDGAWDAAAVHQPRVLQTPDGWVMFYRAFKPGTPGAMAIGYATGADGIHWARFAENPVLTAKEIGRTNFYFTNVLYHEGTYFLYWEVDAGGKTNIHVAAHTGALEE